jgi:hypothetical protein
MKNYVFLIDICGHYSHFYITQLYGLATVFPNTKSNCYCEKRNMTYVLSIVHNNLR